jgi:type IV pilus assembly protein PilW
MKNSSMFLQRGVSLIELMISLVIGLVVVGAVLVSIIGSSNAGRFQAAYGQMNEDAQIGLSILSRDIQMAGYSEPTALVNTGTVPLPVYVLNFGNLATAIFGCDSDFANPVAASVVCGAGANAAIETSYQADTQSTVATGGAPSDCLGSAIAAGPPYIVRNRYYVSSGNSGRPELYCAGVGGSGQPLIENIDSMSILYGMQVAAAPRQVVRYVSATSIAGVGAAEWSNVVSVRICLIVRSAQPVLDSGDGSILKYQDCAGASQVSNDRYLRRAYFTTSTLRARMPL